MGQIFQKAGWCEEEIDVLEDKVWFQFRHSFLLTSSQVKQAETNLGWVG